MALFKILFALLPLAVMAEIKTLDLVGYVDQPCPPGAPCATRPPPSSPNAVDIWHCNGVCTKVYLQCHLDRFQIAIETSETSKLHVYAVGSGANAVEGPWVANDRQCDAGQASDPHGGRNLMVPYNVSGRADRPQYTYADISFDRCGTREELSPDPLNPHNKFFHNELDLVEFLEAKRADASSGVIYLVSHTRVRVQCCYQEPEVTQFCGPPPPLVPLPLAECTEKTFSLSCSSDDNKENFCCNVQLDAGQSLGTQDVGWFVDSCEAYDVNGSQGSVNLFSNGKNPNNKLQIAVGTIQDADVDKLKYTFSGPWIQFDRPADEFPEIHKIGVRCSVKLANRPNLAANQPGSVPAACPATSRNSGAGFLQAGKLSLVQ